MLLYLLKKYFCFKFAIVVLLILFVLIPQSYAFSFAVLGDNRDGDETFKAIIQKINMDDEIAFVVNTGDLTPLSREKEYKKYDQMIKQCRVKFYNAIGNHDIKLKGREHFESLFGPRYYSWNYDNRHFVVLDNVSQRGLGKKQYAWFAQDLHKNKGKIKFVFMHKPLFDVTGSFPDEIMYPKRVGRELIKLFGQNNIKMVCWGHIHGYGRSESNGITYVLTGGAGAPLYLPYFSGGFNHYVKVTVEDDRIKDEVVELN